MSHLNRRCLHAPNQSRTNSIIEGGIEPAEIAIQQNSHKEHLRACKENKTLINAVKKIVTGALEEK